MKKIGESMARTVALADPLRELRQAATGFQFNEQIKAICNAVAIQDWSAVYDNTGNDFNVNDDGTVSVRSQTITQLQLQEVADRLTDKLLGSAKEGLESILRNFLAEMRKEKDPVKNLVLKYLVFPVIVGLVMVVIGPISDFYMKKFLASDQRQFKKLVSKHVIASLENKAGIERYRFVSIRLLQVRSNPSRRAHIMGTLYLGQVVEVLKKSRNWALVKWYDNENDLSLQGWVFSRYLHVFKEASPETKRAM